MILRKHFALFVFPLFFVCYFSGTAAAQDVVASRPRLSPKEGGTIGLLTLSETKTALEESILVWKQGMEEAADEIVHTLNDKHKQSSGGSKKFDLEDLEFEKSAVFQATMYSLQLRVGQTYLPFSFLTKMRPRFSWLEPLATIPPPSSSSSSSPDDLLPPITLQGPMELFFTHSQEVDLRIPHYTDVGFVKRVGVSDSVNITVYGLKGIELISPIDVSVSSRFDSSDIGEKFEEEEGREGGRERNDEDVSVPQIILQWKSPPRLRLYFGSRATISTTSERLKVKRVNHDSIDLYRPTIIIPSPSPVSSSSSSSTSTKSKEIYGELPLDMEDSRAFWSAFRHHSKYLINSETGLGGDNSGQLSIDNLQILGGKAEAVLGFWISLRVSEWEEGEEGHKMSPTEVRASGLTPIYSRWKGLALATPKQRQLFPKGRGSSSGGLVSSWTGRGEGRKNREDKYDWKQVITLVRYPEMIPKITLEPWLLEQMKRNDTLTTQLQELQSLLGTSHIGVEDRPPA